MTAVENKQLIQGIFAELARGNARLLIEAMADDFSWRIIGRTRWSRTYRGKQAVLEELLGPLTARFADRYTNTAYRFIAEDDYVVVQSHGQATTKSGKRYEQEYCFVIRLAGGKLAELTDYLDTALIDQVLD